MAGSLERKQTSGLLIDIALYGASALISFALLNNVLKKLDPNHEGAKQARCRLGQCRASDGRHHRLCRSPRPHTPRRHKPRRRSWPSGWVGHCWTRTSMKTCAVDGPPSAQP